MTFTKPSAVLPLLIPGKRNRSILKTFQSALVCYVCIFLFFIGNILHYRVLLHVPVFLILSKEAAHDENDQIIVYDWVLATTVATKINKQGLIKWQSQWKSKEKGALCRSFFPVVEQRLKMNIPLTLELTAIITGYRKTKSYLYRFKLANNPTCPCNEGVQTLEHIIYECKILESIKKFLDTAHNGQRRELAPCQ